MVYGVCGLWLISGLGGGGAVVSGVELCLLVHHNVLTDMLVGG